MSEAMHLSIHTVAYVMLFISGKRESAEAIYAQFKEEIDRDLERLNVKSDDDLTNLAKKLIEANMKFRLTPVNKLIK